VVPRSQKTGAYIDPLTPEERTFFESSASGLALSKDDLSIHNKKSNYWSTFRVKLDKNVLNLNLSDPMDYLRWKVLLANKDTIAPSAAEKTAKGTYKFAIVEQGHENEEKVKAASSKAEAYKTFGAMMSSSEKMRNFLSVYLTQTPSGKSIPPNASTDFLTAEIEKVIESDLSGYLKVARDKDFSSKVLIYNALRARALEREGLTFKTPEGTVIGDTLESVIVYMNDPRNNEEVIKMKGRIENSTSVKSTASLKTTEEKTEMIREARSSKKLDSKSDTSEETL